MLPILFVAIKLKDLNTFNTQLNKPINNRNMNKNVILVPIDFKAATINALDYSCQLAAKSGYDVFALHIIKSEKDRENAEEKMTALLQSLTNYSAISIESQVIVGTIYEGIPKMAEETNAVFVVMGTNGTNGLQKMFGSKAISVVTESKAPFLMIQESTRYHDIKKIALTIDLDKESIQIVRKAAELGSQFGAEVILIGGDHSDPEFIRRVKINVKMARTHLTEKGIKNSVVLLERKKFSENLLTYCKEEKIGIVAATFYNNTINIFSEKFVQQLLENEFGIPVLTLDSTSVSSSASHSIVF